MQNNGELLVFRTEAQNCAVLEENGESVILIHLGKNKRKSVIKYDSENFCFNLVVAISFCQKDSLCYPLK